MSRQAGGSRVGDDLVQAVKEMAAFLRGEVEGETYEVPDDVLTPSRIKSIRRKVAPSTKEFERRFHIPARTMEAYEQGRRLPNAGHGDAAAHYRSRAGGCSEGAVDTLTEIRRPARAQP